MVGGIAAFTLLKGTIESGRLTAEKGHTQAPDTS